MKGRCFEYQTKGLMLSSAFKLLIDSPVMSCCQLNLKKSTSY
jgi:hypothetical protein